MTAALRRLRGQAGYTLVELLTVLVIFTVILTALVSLFVQGSNAQAEANARFESQQSARLALDKLRREIHCASEAETTGGTGSTSEVTLHLPSHCPTSGGNPVDVKWCTVSAGTSRWALYRVQSGTCSAAGVKWADYLTMSAIFDYQTQASTRRSRLRVELPVDMVPGDSIAGYELCDLIVLRNSLRQTPITSQLGYSDTADLPGC